MATGVEIKDGYVVGMGYFADHEGVKEEIESLYASQGKIGVYAPSDIIVAIGFKYENGKFIAPPVPEPTLEELANAANEQKYALMSFAMSKLISAPVLLMMARESVGDSTDEQKETIRSIIRFYEELKPLDVFTDPLNIDWPDTPAILATN